MHTSGKKTRMLDIKTNYKNKYCENLKCSFCCVLDESFDHIFTCRFGIIVPKEMKHFRLQSFESEVPLLVLEKTGQFLKRYLKYRAYLIQVVGCLQLCVVYYLLYVLTFYYVLGFLSVSLICKYLAVFKHLVTHLAWSAALYICFGDLK